MQMDFITDRYTQQNPKDKPRQVSGGVFLLISGSGIKPDAYRR